MKNNRIRVVIITVLIETTLVFIACNHHPDDREILKTVKWNDIEFNQGTSVTGNQFDIIVEKFKDVFTSNSFTNEERAKFKNHTSSVLISFIGGGWGWQGDSLKKDFKLIVSVPCDSIQSGIENIIRSILEYIDKYFIDGEWHFYWEEDEGDENE